jgi:hypothetical protein
MSRANSRRLPWIDIVASRCRAICAVASVAYRRARSDIVMVVVDNDDDGRGGGRFPVNDFGAPLAPLGAPCLALPPRWRRCGLPGPFLASRRVWGAAAPLPDDDVNSQLATISSQACTSLAARSSGDVRASDLAIRGVTSTHRCPRCIRPASDLAKSLSEVTRTTVTGSGLGGTGGGGKKGKTKQIKTKQKKKRCCQ